MTLATGYVMPGSIDAFIPRLQEDIIIEVGRNPQAFPVNKYIDWRFVTAPKGYYRVMQNNTQGMVINDTDNVWAPGSERPKWKQGTAPFKFNNYQCVRRTEPYPLENVTIDTAEMDLVGQGVRITAQKLMTARTKRIHGVLTTSGNWGSNYATNTSLGGGSYASADATHPYIRKGIQAAQIAINKATYGAVGPDELFLVMNPNVASIISTSGEFLDFIKQQPRAVEIWEAQQQFRLFGLPEDLMGCKIVVDDTSYNSGPPGDVVTNSYTFPDGYVLLISKKRAVNGNGGPSFSTYSPLVYQDLDVETFPDPINRLTNIWVTEYLDDSANGLFAPFSGFLISTS